EPIGSCGLSSVPQERMTARAMVAFVREQHVEREAREIVGDRIDVGVRLLVEDLSIALTAIAAFGTDRVGAAVEREIGKSLHGAAMTTRDADEMPLGRA